ncbi:MAG: hypothetical protein Q4D96_04310 [Propionibacteriaceae bacterium]|nr:hypothetical protein [Propionibacteriaceae bacterium]
MSPGELGRQALGSHVHDADPADLPGMIQLAAAWFTDGPDRGPDGGSWRVRAAVREPQVPHLRLASGWECLASDVVAFQHDGRRLLAQVSQDDDIRIWDPETARLVRRYPSGSSDAELAAACFPGPDGRTLLATGGWDRVIHVSDPTTGTPVGSWSGHEGPIWKLETILDEPPRVVSWSEEDGTRRTWDAWSGEQLTLSPFAQDDPFPWPVTASLACPDGRELTVLGDDEGWLTVAFDGVETAEFQVGPQDSVHGVAAWLDTAGQPRIAVATEYELRVVAPDVTLREVSERHTEPVVAVAGTRELLGTVSHDDTLRVWDIATGQQLQEPVAVEMPHPAVLRHDGSRFVLSAGQLGEPDPFPERRWSLEGQEISEPLVGLDALDGRLVAGWQDGTVTIRDADAEPRFLHLGTRLNAVAALPDGGIAVGLRDGWAIIDLIPSR